MFRWSLDLADYRGKWGFDTKVFRDKWCKEIRPKLLSFEDFTWGQLASQPKGRGAGTKHHHVSVSNLIKDAQKRLKKDLKYDDIDEFFSLRLSGKIRIYGIIINEIIYLVWYDPMHEILPVRK